MNSYENIINGTGLEMTLGKENLKISTGTVAFQANSSVTVRHGDTLVLATVVMSKKPREDCGFLPLLVDYEERLYAAGKISSSRFIKREGRPSDNAILTGRLVDRSLRPLFQENLYNDIQVTLTVLSVDNQNDPDIASLIAASAALTLSDIPWDGPIGAIRVGHINNQFILNPNYDERNESDLDIVVSGTEENILMVESESKEVSEKILIEAIEFAHKEIKKICKLQQELVKKIKPVKKEMPESVKNEELINKVKEIVTEKELDATLFIEKLKRDKKTFELKEKMVETLSEEDEGIIKEACNIFDKLIKEKVRQAIFKEGRRTDGRALNEVRKITAKVSVLPRTHGSGLFTRGYTQVLSILTLGSQSAAQLIEGLEPEEKKRFMHHYNFPPFSVGEVAPMRSPSRREIGHGTLAEKALKPVLPDEKDFPYTIRLVSEVLSSDGSTSMGSVCGSTLALMDAGIKISAPVAGAAMGLIMDENGTYKILTDIAGIEDFCGDMDFKVAGTEKGVTALQMDIKVKGITPKIMEDALTAAKKARFHILDIIKQALPEPRTELSKYAPRMVSVKINPSKIRDLIGPGGKVINGIINETGVEIDIEDDGNVNIFSADSENVQKALEKVEAITKEAKAGEIYQGKVTRVTDFGAFVEIFPRTEGLVHISQLSDKHVEKVTDVTNVGDELKVKVIEIDNLGRINLSHKAAGDDK